MEITDPSKSAPQQLIDVKAALVSTATVIKNSDWCTKDPHAHQMVNQVAEHLDVAAVTIEKIVHKVEVLEADVTKKNAFIADRMLQKWQEITEKQGHQGNEAI